MNRAYISSGMIQPVLLRQSAMAKHSVMKRLSHLMTSSLLLFLPVSTQVIQTVSAVDKDDPIQGHYFDYRLVPEMLNNPNFTIKNNQGV